MRVLSQPPGLKLAELGGCYYVRSGAGRGKSVSIFLIDTGVDIQHEAFRKAKPEEEFYYFAGPDAADMNGPTDSAEYKNHGTHLLSRIIGYRVGLAPEAEVYIVHFVNRYGYYTTAHLFSAMIKAYDNIIEHEVQNAIIVCAWLYDQTQPDNPDSLFQTVYDPPESKHRTNDLVSWLSTQMMTEIFNLRRTLAHPPIVVTTPGTDKIIGSKTEYLSPAKEVAAFSDIIIIAGGTDTKDQKMFDDSLRTQKIRAWAPGENVHGAGYDADGDASMELLTGASYAVAHVAGMIALYVSEKRSDDVKSARDDLYSQAHQRAPGGPKIIWNGILKSEWPTYIPTPPGSPKVPP
ncbi:hypothetical protein TWF694_011656 [Orbilia ellipsospora]|uniref:Peptidase S8/S53 domain-containing protein n=1 Tax=Orbilia ellipsospora TaxID=2528407 RepID=A0AAV9X792_9PEZI